MNTKITLIIFLCINFLTPQLFATSIIDDTLQGIGKAFNGMVFEHCYQNALTKLWQSKDPVATKLAEGATRAAVFGLFGWGIKKDVQGYSNAPIWSAIRILLYIRGMVAAGYGQHANN